MDRRGRVRAIAGPLCALLITLGAALSPAAPAFATPEPPRPPTTVSDFFPVDNNLSDCLGLLERPGCGSESRGGWGQTVVFVLLASGLGVIFWRVSIGVRRNREGS